MRSIEVAINVSASATARAIQIPFVPNISGRIRMAATWITRVLKNEIAADNTPLLSAVKKADPKILNPATKNDIEYKRNAVYVIANSSASYPTKRLERGLASISAKAVMVTAAILITTRLLRNNPCSSL